jgi:DNA-binding response OmpR family regulator
MVQAVSAKRKVLVVEDEPSLRKLYEIELSKEGYEVRLAADGQEALALVRGEKPDIIVMDIRMRGLDGIQTMHWILEENNDLPVIINTAFSSYKENFMSWAANRYIIKSSDLTELKETIRSLLE